MEPDPELRSSRESFLSSLLALLSAAGAMFVFFLICGGFSFFIVAVVGGMTLFGLAHYLLWGHALSEQVAAEREEGQLRELLEADDGESDGPLSGHSH